MRFETLKVFSTILLLSFPTLMGQQFSVATVLVPSEPGVSHSLPFIDLGSNGVIGMAWSKLTDSEHLIYYSRLLDRGQTLLPPVLVDSLAISSSQDISFLAQLEIDNENKPWVVYGNFQPFYYRFYVKRSDNGGNSFPNSSSFADGVKYSYGFMVNKSNKAFLALQHFGSRDIMTWQSNNGGLSFNDTVRIHTNGNSPIYNNPLIELNNDDVLSFFTGQHNTTFESNIFYSRSSDDGQTFGSIVDIDTVTDVPINVMPATWQNYVFLIYRGTDNNNDARIWFKVSDDYGHTYSARKLIYQFPTLPNALTYPEVRFNPNVGLCVLWNAYADSAGYTQFCYSQDYGETFSSPVSVNVDPRSRFNFSMAVSDSGDVYVTSLTANDEIVMTKASLPTLVGIGNDDKSIIANQIQLKQNYPNPFNGETLIKFSLASTNSVSLEVFDLQGRLIKTLLQKFLSAGEHQIKWEGKDITGNFVASGIYFYQIVSGKERQVRKLLIIK